MKKWTTLATASALALVLTCILAQAALAGLPDFTELAEAVGFLVVNISTETNAKTGSAEQLRQFLPKGGTPFDDFFDQFFKQGEPAPRKQRSLGSGFIISADGFILTNNHVVEKADAITVKLQGDKKEYRAKLVGQDTETDLALIKIEPGSRLPALEFGDSDDAKVGEWVVAIGNPFGLNHTVTAGIISAKGRIIGAGPYDDFIQTDASINPGNSGGPLLNMDGKVIGVNTAIVAAGQGIGFAIPSDTVEDVMQQLKDNKKVRRGLLGVHVQDVDQNTAKALGLGKARGALVAQVMNEGPALDAGLQAGDVITAVNGEDVEDSHELTRKIGAMAPGDKVELALIRKGDEKSVSITLGERDPEKLAQANGDDEGAGASDAVLGMSLRPLTSKEAKALDAPSDGGLLVVDLPIDSPAAENGVRPGDVLLQANQKTLSSVGDLEKVVADARKGKGVVMVLVSRRGQNIFRTIPLEEK